MQRGLSAIDEHLALAQTVKAVFLCACVCVSVNQDGIDNNIYIDL